MRHTEIKLGQYVTASNSLDTTVYRVAKIDGFRCDLETRRQQHGVWLHLGHWSIEQLRPATEQQLQRASAMGLI